MAMDSEPHLRRQAIETALASELQRQGHGGSVDIEALAEAVVEALDPTPPLAEGKRPSDLNSTNDD